MVAIIKYTDKDGGQHSMSVIWVTKYDEVEKITDELLDHGYSIESVTLR